jgi:periplasmic protein TonB
MNAHQDDSEDRPSFFRRHGIALGAGIVVALLAVAAVYRMATHHGPAPRRENLAMVDLLPPPPPPTPPPPPPPRQEPPEQKMIEQPAVTEQESKPKSPDEKPKELAKIPEPPGPLGTNIKGNGPADGFGLGSSGGNGLAGTGVGGGGSRWGWYAGEVQTKIAEALRRNSRTRNAGLSVKVRVWPDITGRITRAQLEGTTGNPGVDDAIKNEVLTGLQLPEPPPAGMPAPIILRLTARRPN